ncbi:MAG TPA: TatD family hydrolase [Candidatus Babeliales bacterium]|jgi:TatD DNase family protein|nr:TatD family hydrolase [Candidatus Babeliales bacterium]
MLVDTHCHINMMIKNSFDTPLEKSDLPKARTIIDQANAAGVSLIINVGTRSIENGNCVLLAQTFDSVFATVGIHPNDSDTWQEDYALLKTWVQKKEENKIVGIGECGIDMHYPGYNITKQRDAFKAQIELALEHDLALVVHSRDAYDETLRILEEYRHNLSPRLRQGLNGLGGAVMHCFSYDQAFATTVTDWQLMLGIGGTLTYPKNNELRDIVATTDLKNIVLETDAPFLPPQIIRGKQNHPKEIAHIAQFIADLRGDSFEKIAEQTTKNALNLFGIKEIMELITHDRYLHTS